MTDMTAIDLFCGAGGLSAGFEAQGYTVLAGNDIDNAAGETFKASHPHAIFLEGQIEEYSSEDFLKSCGISKGELDCLIGGPPCQAFSVYNHQRGMHDRRSRLFKEYLRIVEGIMPSWVILENVTGITSVGKGKAVKDILAGLAELGYQVEFRVLKAENFGVPQERRRIIFVGNRLGLSYKWPAPTYGNDSKPFVTVWDAISDLPPLANGEGVDRQKYKGTPQNNYQRLMREGTKYLYNHVAPRLAKINLERMKHIPEGGSWRDIPFDLLPAGMKKARRCDHTKRYGRLSKQGFASTILTKCDLHWGAFIHPEQDRVLTVREAARLQSFPDSFKFLGSRTEQYIQVGNAVPPLLAAALAEGITGSCEPAKTTEHDSLCDLALAS